jgi:cell division protein FtsB
MNQPLTKISILLLFFYGTWLIWEQFETIKKQNQQIKQLNQENNTLQKQLYYDLLIFNSIKKKN